MKFAVVLLSFLIAEEVIELEPVTATGDCASTPTGNLAACNAKWWCAYHTSGNCIDDPCLKVQDDDTGCQQGSIVKEGINCKFYPGPSTNQNLAKHDCSATVTNGGYCGAVKPYPPPAPQTAVPLDYCAYASLRDSGTCPQSICKKDTNQDNKCVSNIGVQRCTMLSEGDCKLEPKCYYKSGQCLQDPCFAGTDDNGNFNEGRACANWIPTTRYADADPFPTGFAPGDCSKEYKPYKNDGGQTTYCIYKDHSDDPNLCYFLGSYGNDTSSPDDYFRRTSLTSCEYTGTYPTYIEFGTGGSACVLNPECTATIAGCDGVQECTTKFNPSGAFAGQYCGDATHGAAMSLRIPSVIAFLVIAFFAFFN